MATFADFFFGANLALWEEAIADIFQSIEDQREASLNAIYLSTALIAELADRYGVLVGAKPDPRWQLEVFREHLQEVIQAYLMMSSSRAGIQQVVAATTQVPPILRPIQLLQRWLLGFQYFPNRFYIDLDGFITAEVDGPYEITDENNLLVLKINGVEQSFLLPIGDAVTAKEVIDSINSTIIGALAFPFGKRFALETIETDVGGSIQVKVESTADTLFGLDNTLRENAPLPNGTGVLPFGWRLSGSYVPPPPLTAEDPVPLGTHSQPISFDGALFGVSAAKIVGTMVSPFVGLLSPRFLKNGSFEDGFTEWDRSEGLDFFISTTKFRTGSKSLAVVTKTQTTVDTNGQKTIESVLNTIKTFKKFIPEGCTILVSGYHQAQTPGAVYTSPAGPPSVFEWTVANAVFGYVDQQFSRDPFVADLDAPTISLTDSSVNFITEGVKAGMAVHVSEGSYSFDAVVKGVSTHTLLLDQWRNGPDGGPTTAHIQSAAEAGSGVTYTPTTLQDPAKDFDTLGVQVGADYRTRDKLRVDETLSHFGQVTTERQVVRDIASIDTTTNPNDTLTPDGAWGPSPTPQSATIGTSGNPYSVYIRPHDGAEYTVFHTLNEIPDFADDFARVSASFLYEVRFYGFDGRLVHSEHHLFRPEPGDAYEQFSFDAVVPRGAQTAQLAITVGPDNQITEEVSVAFDTPLSLSQKNLVVESETVVVQPSGVLLTRGPAPNYDYDMDYVNGLITVHSNGPAAKTTRQGVPLVQADSLITLSYSYSPKPGAVVSIDDLEFRCEESELSTELHVAIDGKMQKIPFIDSLTKASGTITYTDLPDDADTLQIGSETYEFDAGAADFDEGVITYTTNPSEGATVTIGGIIYEFDTDTIVGFGHVGVQKGLTAFSSYDSLRTTINATTEAFTAVINGIFGTVTVTSTEPGPHSPPIPFETTDSGATLNPNTGFMAGGSFIGVVGDNIPVLISAGVADAALTDTYTRLVEQINLNSTSVTAEIDTTLQVVTVRAIQSGIEGNEVAFLAVLAGTPFTLAPTSGHLEGGTEIHAGGHVEYTGQPLDGETLTIGAMIYEFDDDGSTTGTNVAIPIGTTANDTYATLVGRVNTDSIVTAEQDTTLGRVSFTAIVGGTGGNSIAFSGTITNATLFPNAGFLSGAVNGEFVDSEAPTCEEVRDYINLRAEGFTASCDTDGHLVLTSDTSGFLSCIVVGHGSSNGILGFENDKGKKNSEDATKPAWRINVGRPPVLGSMGMDGDVEVLIMPPEMTGGLDMDGDLAAVLTPPSGTDGVFGVLVNDTIDSTFDKIGLDGFLWDQVADAQSQTPQAFTAQTITVRLSAALTGTETLVIALNVNGSDTALVATFNSGTGAVVTGTATVAVADSDLLYFSATLGGGLASATLRSVFVEIEV